MEGILKVRGLWTIVNGTLPKPDQTTSPDIIADWDLKNIEAHTQIILSLKDGSILIVLDTPDAKDVWTKLNVRYEGLGDQRVIQLINEVFRVMLSDSEPLEPQINSIMLASRTMSNLGLQLTDRLVASSIIASLPDSLDTIKTVLSTTKGSELTVEYIKAQLLLHEQGRIRNSGVAATAYFAKAVKKGKGKGKDSDKPKKHCKHCKHIGHDISECRKKKREEEAKAADSNAQKPAASSSSAPQNASAHIATAVDTTPREEEHTTVKLFRAQAESTGMEKLQHKWIMDSGASHIMCSNHSWFQHFSPLATPTRVILGDDSHIDGTGVGRIYARMMAGNKLTNVILQDVLFVLDLHCNLLSVAHLTSHGANIHFVNNACTICDKSNAMFCTSSWHNNLYIMDVQTIPPATT